LHVLGKRAEVGLRQGPQSVVGGGQQPLLGGEPCDQFTGDLTQSGSTKEFTKLTEEPDWLREELKRLDSDPVILAVPGNHDLKRPGPTSGTVALARGWAKDPAPRDQLWKRKPNGDGLPKGVTTAFAQWKKWWRAYSQEQQKRRKDTLVEIHDGLVPGDLRATLAVRGRRIGVIGLNTAFLQLEGGDLEKKLSVGVPQLHELCKDGGEPWAQDHDACFLLTHHPPNWLDEDGQSALRGEIAPPGRFAAHL
jgi:hypothetical protein